MITIERQPVTITQFPDGTSKFTCESFDFIKNIKQAQASSKIEIEWFYDNDAEIFELQCVVDWIRSHGHDNLQLFMPYVPNARMDRVQDDEMFTLKSFANLINNMNFSKVYTLDIHSNVGAALINNIENIKPNNYISNVINNLLYVPTDHMVLFFPDEGAMKRYANIAKTFHMPYVFGMKNRDWKTGQIKSLSVLGETDDIAGKDVLIIDDICSKGGTFYHSAKALKDIGVNDIYLYISHLENAVHEGDMIKSGLIKQIFTTNSIYRPSLAPYENADKITIIPLT